MQTRRQRGRRIWSAVGIGVLMAALIPLGRAQQAGPAKPPSSTPRLKATPGSNPATPDPSPHEARLLSNLKNYQFKVFQSDVEARKQYWSRLNFSSLSSYNRSLEPYRRELLRCLGVPQELQSSQKITLVSSRLVQQTPDAYIYHWTLALPDLGLQTESLVGLPRNRKPPYPVVVGYYGSLGSPERVFGLDGVKDYHKQFGLTLVRAGYLVYVPYLVISYKDMMEVDAGGFSRDMRIIGLEIGLTMRALDYLSTQPYVDKLRMNVFGISYGGTLASYLGGCDPRIKVTVASGAFGDAYDYPTRDQLANPTLYYVSYDHIRRFDTITRAYLIAPRMFFVEHGEKDGFVQYRVQSGFDKVKAVYQRLGVAERCGLEKGSGGHEVYLNRSLDFLESWSPPAVVRK
jgi:hypothetical protein